MINKKFGYENQLRAALIDASREATVASYQQAGTGIRHWDDIKLLDEAGDKLGRLDMELAGTVIYTAPAVDLPEPLLQSSRISLLESSTSHGHIMDLAQQAKHSAFLIGVVDARVKNLEVALHDTTAPSKPMIKGSATPVKPPSKGTVFFSPDSPVLAIHQDDIAHVTLQERKLGNIDMEHDDPRVPGLVSRAFGSEAVEQLSDPVCKVLYEAIKSAKVRTATLHDF